MCEEPGPCYLCRCDPICWRSVGHDEYDHNFWTDSIGLKCSRSGCGWSIGTDSSLGGARAAIDKWNKFIKERKDDQSWNHNRSL